VGALACEESVGPRLPSGVDPEADGGRPPDQGVVDLRPDGGIEFGPDVGPDQGRDAGPADVGVIPDVGPDLGPPDMGPPPPPDACQLALGVRCPEFTQAYVKASNTAGSARFGSAVAIDGDTMAVGAPNEAGRGPGVNGDQSLTGPLASGAVYVFVRTSTVWTQQAYIKAAVPQTGAAFGFSLALDGDTLAVGAPREDGGPGGARPNVGAVHVFTRSANVWAEQARLVSESGEAGQELGFRVDLDADVLVAGAPSAGSGAACVFTRSGTTWRPSQVLRAGDAGTDADVFFSDSFGTDVAIDGGRIAVGAPFEDSGVPGIDGDETDTTGPNSGAVYLFTRTRGGWGQEAFVKASNPGSFDNFGVGVALDGDRLAVGAPGESSNATGIGGNQSDDSASRSGAVYIFDRAGGAWSQSAYVKASNSEANDFFGVELALEGDRLAVVALLEDSGATDVNGSQTNNDATDAGAVHLFDFGAGGWSQTAFIKASNTGRGDGFGRAIDLSGTTLVVGADQEDSAATGINGAQIDDSAAESGAAYVRIVSP